MAKASYYNTVGHREDLLDVISQVSPKKTPLFSMLNKHSRPKNELQEWQADNLDDPNWEDVVDGEDITTYSNQAANRVMLSNRIQEHRTSYQVTRLQEDLVTAGVDSEVARSQARCVLHHKRYLNGLTGSTQDVRAGTGAQSSRLRALGKSIDSTNTDIPSIARTVSGAELAIGSVTEEGFNGVLQALYEESGEEDNFVMVANTNAQQKMTRFLRYVGDGSASSESPTFRVNHNSSSTNIDLRVTGYRGDFGSVRIVKDLLIGRTKATALNTAAKDTAYIFPKDCVSLGFVTNPTLEPHEDKGGGKRGMCRSVLSLIVKNPKACGKITS